MTIKTREEIKELRCYKEMHYLPDIELAEDARHQLLSLAGLDLDWIEEFDIGTTFTWDTTPQGFDYWDQLYQRLVEHLPDY